MRVATLSLCALVLSSTPALASAVRVERLDGPPVSGGPVAAARAALAVRPQLAAGVSPGDLIVDQITKTGDGGAAVRLGQRAHGLRVLGRSITVRVDAAGRPRWARTSLAPMPVLAAPTVDAASALATAVTDPARRAPVADGLDPAIYTEQVVFAPEGAVPRRAWLVVPPNDPIAVHTWRFVIDGATGEILVREDLALRDRLANVYQENPSRTPIAVTTLPGLSPGALTLTSSDVVAMNCLERRECVPFMGTFFHLCSQVQTAAPDGSGDFTAYTFVDDLEAEDTFAEVSMYFHTQKVHDAFRVFASDPAFVLDAHPLNAVANFRIPDLGASLAGAICSSATYTGTGELVFFDNAAFFPAGGLLGAYPPDDMILFGQGTRTDFAYDGDAVYHEFGHGVMKRVTPLFGVTTLPDPHGRDSSPGGMNEGYADYFSSAITGDSIVGDYALTPLGGARDLDNQAECPEDLWGEVHQDSVPWTGALWASRLSFAEVDRPAFDRAVYVAMTALDTTDGFASAMEATLAEVETAFSAPTAVGVRAIFHDRSIDDCKGRVLAAATKDVVYLAGRTETGVNTVPTAFQWTFDVPAGTKSIKATVSASQAAGGGLLGGSANVSILVKPGTEPILWDWSVPNAPTHDAPISGALALSTAGFGGGEGYAYGDLPAGPVHVMLINTGGPVVAQAVTFTASTELMPDAAPPTVDGGVDAGAGADGGGGGCGCRVGGPTRAPGLVGIGLALAAIVVARRRRRR